MNEPRYGNNQGFTLVELLVALLISGIILAAIMKIFIQSQVTYNVQEEVAAMQQNVRTAKMFLERDVRMAGSGIMGLAGTNGGSILPLRFANNDGATGTDRLTIRYEKPNSNPCGASPKTPATMLCSDLPPLTLKDKGSDTATVANITQDLDVSPYDAWDSGICSCGETVYNLGSNNALPFIVTNPDKSISKILVATGANPGGGTDSIKNGPLVKYTDIPSPGNAELYDFLDIADTNTKLANKQLNEFEEGSLISFFTPGDIYDATYYVQVDGNGISSLYRDLNDGEPAEIIAEHIEDFQSVFILEDGTEIGDAGTEILTDAQIPQVRLVRLNILGRSAHEHIQAGGKITNIRPEIEDHAAAAANDHYRRRQLTVTVKVRNFGL